MKFKTILACIVKILNSLNVLKREHKNKSEKIFEQYLNSNGFRGQWTYEPSIHGKNKKLDYLLYHDGQECFFEVKELREKTEGLKDRREEIEKARDEFIRLMKLSGGINPCPTSLLEEINEAYERLYKLMGLIGNINPYPTSLRAKIHEVRKQFKEYKEYCCSLVVFNVSDEEAILDPLFVLIAMLGNLGFATTLNVPGSGRNVFRDGGKMINCKSKQPQNTTISDIIVLEDNFVDDSKYQMAINDEMKRQNRPLTSIERFAIAEIESPHSTSVTRVVVVENPFARKPLPDGLFVGSFDERWRWTMQTPIPERVFVGNKLEELEELKNKE